MATVTPEAWLDDHAVEADPPGETEWDCTRYLLILRAVGAVDEEELARETASPACGWLDRADLLFDDPAAPAWLETWSGPFTIRVRRVEG